MNTYCSITSTDYAKSKYRAGKVIDEYIKNKKLQAVTVCPGMIYGPGDENFIPSLLKYLKRNQVLLVSGGEEDAPLIYVDDLCELFWRAGISDNVVGKTYIGIGPGGMGIHDFIRLLVERMIYPIPRRVVPKIFMLPIAIFMEMLWHLLKKKESPFISKRVVDVLSIH